MLPGGFELCALHQERLLQQAVRNARMPDTRLFAMCSLREYALRSIYSLRELTRRLGSSINFAAVRNSADGGGFNQPSPDPAYLSSVDVSRGAKAQVAESSIPSPAPDAHRTR